MCIYKYVCMNVFTSTVQSTDTSVVIQSKILVWFNEKYFTYCSQVVFREESNMLDNIFQRPSWT